MSERSKYLTVIISDPTKEEASALIGHPKMSAASWSHAINDRDAKDAEIAELLAFKRAFEQGYAYEAIKAERDEARECVGRLYKALCDIACDQKDFAFVTGETMESAGAALAATPEHLLP